MLRSRALPWDKIYAVLEYPVILKNHREYRKERAFETILHISIFLKKPTLFPFPHRRGAGRGSNVFPLQFDI
jgi:hypothetical protein